MTASPPAILGVLGNFAGSTGPALSERGFEEIDPDRFDSVIRRLNPTIELDLSFCPRLKFTKWGDFHPSAIADRVPSLKALLYAREEVGNVSVLRQHLAEAGASEALAEARVEQAPPATREPVPSGAEEGEGGEGLLDSILGEAGEPAAVEGARAPKPIAPRGSGAMPRDREFDRLIRAIADGSTDTTDFAAQDARRSAIDAELGRRMRAILGHPAFRGLEASWIGVREIMRRANDADRVRVRILDLRLEEVAAGAEGDLEQNPLHEIICGPEAELPGAERFAFLIADFQIEDTAEDLRAAAYLAAVAAGAGAPLLAAAGASLCAADEPASEAWRALRSSPLGGWLALAHPRVLLRLPYGPETNPIEDFDFDEFAGEGGEEEAFSRLWGNSSLLVGRALARAAASTGDVADFPGFASIGDLPVHVYRQDGEVRSTGPMERLIGEAFIEGLSRRGIVPVVGFVGGDSAQVVSLRSVSGGSILARS